MNGRTFSCRERNRKSRCRAIKKAPSQHRDGTLYSRGTTLIIPKRIEISLAGHKHVPSFLTRARTPAWLTHPLSSLEGFQLAAPEGFSVSFSAPASTVPGSLGAYFCLLVSITAFSIKGYQMPLSVSIFRANLEETASENTLFQTYNFVDGITCHLSRALW